MMPRPDISAVEPIDISLDHLPIAASHDRMVPAILSRVMKDMPVPSVEGRRGGFMRRDVSVTPSQPTQVFTQIMFAPAAWAKPSEIGEESLSGGDAYLLRPSCRINAFALVSMLICYPRFATLS